MSIRRYGLMIDINNPRVLKGKPGRGNILDPYTVMFLLNSENVYLDT